MTREQAINYLRSSGYSEEQIGDIVKAFSQPYTVTYFADKCKNCGEIMNDLVNERVNQKWIDPHEMLPKPYQECLFTVETHHWADEPAKYIVIQKAYGGETNFIAWMPLPEPYKGDEK